MKKIFLAVAALIFVCGCAEKCAKSSALQTPAQKSVLTITGKSKYQIIFPDLPANSPRIAI